MVLVATLVSYSACLTDSSRIFHAIDQGDIARVKRLLEHGANPNNSGVKGRTPLAMAAERCDQMLIELLFTHGASPTSIAAELALRRATRTCDAPVVATLITHGVDPNAHYYLGGTVLMGAVERGDPSVVKLLLDSGADPNQLGRYEGWVQPKIGEGTALMLTAKAGRPDLAELVLEHGANPTATDVYGYTALRVAEEHGQAEVLELIRASIASRVETR